MKTAVVIAAHGSRREEFTGPELARMTELVGGLLPGAAVYWGALQFNRPDLAEAIEAAVAGGARRVVVAPMFLFAGNHVALDIPAVIDEVRERFPEIEIVLAGHIGSDPRVADILADRVREVIADAVY